MKIISIDALYTVSNAYNQMQVHKCDCCQKYRATHYVEYENMDGKKESTKRCVGLPCLNPADIQKYQVAQ
jgi:hypothetical protein